MLIPNIYNFLQLLLGPANAGQVPPSTCAVCIIH